MNTGFNLVNVPDSPELLAQKSSRKFGVIDCLQRYFLPSITIRATEDEVIHGDFLKLYDTEDDSKFAYYVINSYEMTSGDTVKLDVAMEPLLTCGGIDNITILDGMTSRHHLAKGEKIPTEKDPLLIPRRIYIAAVAACDVAIPENNLLDDQQYKLIVRSTLDPVALKYIANQPSENILKPAVNVNANLDPTTMTIQSYSGTFVSSPVLSIQSDPDECTRVGFGHENYEHEMIPTKDMSDGTFYISVGDGALDLSFETLSNALVKLSEYGREDVILDAYYLPVVLLENSGSTRSTAGGFATLLGKLREAANYTDVEENGYKILPQCGSFGPADVHNWRAYFGDHFAYTFFSPDNNQSIKINTEEFFKDGMNYVEGEPVFPEVLESCDFRPGGNISYNIMTEQPFVFGLSPQKASPYNISTDSWDTASLNFSAVSSGAIKAKNYAMASQNKDEAVEIDIQNQIENKRRGARAVNPFNQISASMNQIYNEDAYNLNGDRTGNMIYNKISAAGGNEYAKARYDRMLQRETEDMEFANSMVPKTQVVSKASGSSIMNGQGLIVFRNYIDSLDLIRFDQILNKYGCKHTTTLTKDMLTNRPLFNYIETNGVSIKCSTVPKSVRDELANAFNTGLRIWHVKDVNVNAWNDPVEEES